MKLQWNRNREVPKMLSYIYCTDVLLHNFIHNCIHFMCTHLLKSSTNTRFPKNGVLKWPIIGGFFPTYEAADPNTSLRVHTRYIRVAIFVRALILVLMKYLFIAWNLIIWLMFMWRLVLSAPCKLKCCFSTTVCISICRQLQPFDAPPPMPCMASLTSI